jgi:hypothetical protein
VDKDEDTIRAELYKRFRNQGPAYYGDMDEADGAVLADDADLERQGSLPSSTLALGLSRNIVTDHATIRMANRVGSSMLASLHTSRPSLRFACTALPRFSPQSYRILLLNL